MSFAAVKNNRSMMEKESIGDRLKGLTEGVSSRYLRANRSELLPSLASLREANKNTERKVALHGRLEELLVSST